MCQGGLSPVSVMALNSQQNKGAQGGKVFLISAYIYKNYKKKIYIYICMYIYYNFIKFSLGSCGVDFLLFCNHIRRDDLSWQRQDHYTVKCNQGI